MKNIIVPIDYSDNAANAMHYAAALASAAKARLVLFHAFPYPVITDMPADFIQRLLDETAADQLNRLHAIKLSLEKQYGIEVACRSEAGPVHFSFPKVMQQEKGDLAVMGLRGANPALHILMGSNTTGILRRGKIPLLIVPATASFRTPGHILFACDNPLIENDAALRPLKEMAALFAAEVEVYMLEDAVPVSAKPKQPRPSNLETHFGRIKHVYTFDIEEGVREQILEAIAASKADILAMMPHHRSVWAYLFNQSDTLSVALQATVPMLVLPEKSGHV